MESIAFTEREKHQRMLNDLNDLLTDWLIEHIRYEDKKIGRAMEQHKKRHAHWHGSFA